MVDRLREKVSQTSSSISECSSTPQYALGQPKAACHCLGSLIHQNTFHRDTLYFARETISDQHSKIYSLNGYLTVLATRGYEIGPYRERSTQEYVQQISDVIRTRALAPQLFENKLLLFRCELKPANSRIGNQTEPRENAPFSA